jgi:hypothetical protein
VERRSFVAHHQKKLKRRNVGPRKRPMLWGTGLFAKKITAESELAVWDFSHPADAPIKAQQEALVDPQAQVQALLESWRRNSP